MRGNRARSFIFGAGALAFLAAGPAAAADFPVKAPPAPAVSPSMFKVEFGGGLTTDYIFRGTTQSNRGPSANAFATAVWGDFFYLGIAGASVNWPSRANYQLSNPAAEIDFYGGIRPTFGKWSFDLGGIYYYYPKETAFDSEFWEVYALAEYELNDQLTLNAGIHYSPDYLNYGFRGTTGTLGFEWTAPATLPYDVGFFISGEIGKVWLKPSAGAPNYAFWNAGFGWTWKAFTLDLRYHDTDLSGTGCMGIWQTAGTGVRKWCGTAYVATLSFELDTDGLK